MRRKSIGYTSYSRIIRCINGWADLQEGRSKSPRKTPLTSRVIMTTTYGMTNTLLTEINKSRELLLCTNATHRLILVTPRRTNLKRKAQPIFAFILPEELVLKESTADSIIVHLKKKILKKLLKIT